MASMAITESWGCTMEDLDLERICPSEIGGALLMEFLGDSYEEVAEDDRLGYVMRSLEAEIGGEGSMGIVGDNESTTGPFNDSGLGDGGLEELLSDLDSDESSRSSTMTLFVEGCPCDAWVDMDAAPASTYSGGHVDIGSWCMEEDVSMDEMVGYDGAFYCPQPTVPEEAYSPLWQ